MAPALVYTEPFDPLLGCLKRAFVLADIPSNFGDPADLDGRSLARLVGPPCLHEALQARAAAGESSCFHLIWRGRGSQCLATVSKVTTQYYCFRTWGRHSGQDLQGQWSQRYADRVKEKAWRSALGSGLNCLSAPRKSDDARSFLLMSRRSGGQQIAWRMI